MKIKSTITYLKPVSLLTRLFGGIVFLFAFVVIIFFNYLFGFFMLSFGIYLASSEGSQINFDTNKFRNIWSIFGIHFGKWVTNPKYEYISVFKGKQKQRVNSLGASTSFSDDVYLVNLFHDRNQHKTFYRTFDKEDAFKVAQHFKLAMDLNILDATEPKQKWLD